jgi:hypothetical protein
MQSSIAPVPVWPDEADTLSVVGLSGLPPSYTYFLQKAIITPATKDTEKSVSYLTLKQGTNMMSQEQWDDWTDQPDDSYILKCVADTLGLTLIP